MNSKTLNGNAVTPAYDANHPHAVSGYGGNNYTYDANGNMATRTINGQTTSLGYDAENRLANASGAATAQYTYDGDGKLVKAVDNAGTTVYVGGYFEDFYPSGGGETCRNYIFANGQRIAEREYSGSVTIGTYFLLNDLLGSLSVTINSDGTLRGELRYSAYGEERLNSGTTSTDYRYTGQLSKMVGIGLYFYQARFYDPVISHFAQADTIVPNLYNPQDWDRYSYVRNNPVNFNDPTGHKSCEMEEFDGTCGRISGETIAANKYISKVYDESHINVYGLDWTLKQTAIIYHSITRMINGIDDLTGGNGKQWVQKNLGEAEIVPGNLFGHAYVSGSTVHLLDDFDNYIWQSPDNSTENMIIHELGHVFDNRWRSGWGDATWFGGSLSDGLMNFMGGKPTAIFRWWDHSLKIPDSAAFEETDGYAYGNNSSADYFAHTFAATVSSPTNKHTPPIAQMWMAAVITLTQ